MDVIGNNIANVNTTAYKSSSMTFSALMSQTTQKASGANATTGVGGTNAKQIGLGVKSGAINTSITTQGSAQSTGNPFDIMITGENFFIVSNGSENFFTRDGSFYVDGSGNLAMTSTGYNVMGWQVDEETNTIKQDTVSALRIMNAANLTYPPEATSKAYISGIIDSDDTDVTSSSGKSVNLNFYDNLGYSYTAKFTFKQSGTDNKSYSLELTRLLDSDGNEVDISGMEFGSSSTQAKSTAVSLNTDAYTWDGTTLKDTSGNTVVTLSQIFNADGTVADQDQLDALAKAYGYEGSTEEFINLYVTDDSGTNKTIAEMIMDGTLSTQGTAGDGTSFTTDGRYFSGYTVKYNDDTGVIQSVGGSTTNLSITAGFSQLGGNFSDITIDLSESVAYANKGTSTIGATTGDVSGDGTGTGRMLGNMTGVAIQQDGMIYASYDNGMTKLLGQIATANFANASGLEKEGDNLYSATLNSGEFDGIGVDVTANGGKMSTGQLEMSNVDLSTEFTEMITTQRGFQANSRIITVSDTLLEELTNLKR